GQGRAGRWERGGVRGRSEWAGTVQGSGRFALAAARRKVGHPATERKERDMKKRVLWGVPVLIAALVAAVVASSATGSGKASGTILIGISAAKTGILAPYDLQSAQLFQMRIAQINKAGGGLGKQIKVQWIDTKSDKPTAASNAEELISKGAVAIIATCDFDYSFPAINAAHSHKVPGIALCASSPKVATPAIVGPYGGSMG